MQAHIESANALQRIGNEWAAVAWFYATYRAAQAALATDPRLDSDEAARQAHPSLTSGARFVDYHQGGKSRPPGMNEVVRMLYRDVAARYLMLHNRSMEVRYGVGVDVGDLGRLASTTAEVITYWEDMGLVSAPGPVGPRPVAPKQGRR